MLFPIPKLKTLAATALVAVSIFSTTPSFAAGDGVGTGNGSLVTGIKFALSDEHPYQLELMQLLEKAKLPASLREAVLSDLSSVSILYSDEDITFNDLQDKIRWDVVSASKRRVEENGQVRERTVINYDMATEANQYGLYYHTIGEIKSGVTNPHLAALTSSYENKVIYFRTGLRSLTKEEQIVLTLHEQAHRLIGLLGEKTKDERFVEGWAQGLYNYLIGAMKQEEFYRLLDRNGVNTFTPADAGKLCQPKCFTNEQLVNAASAGFESQVTALVKPQHIRLYGPSGSNGFVLSLDPSAFSNYPLLANEKEIAIKMSVTGQAGYDLVTDLIEKARSNPSGEVMSFRIRFQRKISYNEKTKASEQNVRLNDVDLSTEEFSNQIATLREVSKPYFSNVTISRTNTPFVLLDPEIRMVTQEGLGQLILWTKGLSENATFAKELKFLNAKKPISVQIDPLSDNTNQLCLPDNNYNHSSYRPIECLDENHEFLRFRTNIGLKNLTVETLTGRLTFGLIDQKNDASVLFFRGGGVTDEQIQEFKKAPAIQELMTTLFKPKSSQLKIFIGFLAEDDYDAKVTVVTKQYEEHIGNHSRIGDEMAGISVRINRAYRNDPEGFAEAVKKILKNKKMFVFDDDAVRMPSMFRFRGGSGRRLSVERKNNENIYDTIIPASAGAEIVRGLGLE